MTDRFWVSIVFGAGVVLEEVVVARALKTRALVGAQAGRNVVPRASK